MNLHKLDENDQKIVDADLAKHHPTTYRILSVLLFGYLMFVFGIGMLGSWLLIWLWGMGNSALWTGGLFSSGLGFIVIRKPRSFLRFFPDNRTNRIGSIDDNPPA